MNSQPNTLFLPSLFLTFFLFPTILKASATNIPLNFSFTSINQSDPEILLEGNATVSTEGIDLTKNLSDKEKNASVGRATYIKPLHLWDKASGNRTNFTTHFSIIVDELGRPKYDYGDGLAFFLAPNGSRILPGTKPGGGLGLAINDSMAENFKENNFVAVEFDTYPNEWDPNGVTGHVGINVRSMSSNATVIWPSTEIKERKTNAWINYDSSKKVLNVTFSYTDQISNKTIHNSSSAVVDLAEYLPEWVTLGFSGSAGLFSEVHRITSWEFNSSSDIVDSVSTVSMPNVEPAASPGIPNESKNNIGLVAGLIIGVVICVLILCGGFVLLRFRRKQRKQRKEMKTDDVVFDVSFDDDFKNGTGPRKFSYNELADATNNFLENEKLGEGGFGAVYRGFLNDLNSYIAVKRVSGGSKQGIKEYAAEVKIISRMRHRNLVKLVGWCHEKELVLAYELMPNGSLDSHLFMGKSLLTWTLRYKIARGLASALLYLHEEGDQCVLHRDIKSSNVMLDSNFEAKLGDFGLARLVDHEKGYQTTVLAGTMGYMAPECFTSGKASKESDIYSFGVVALEIACGRRVVEPRLQENEKRLVEWVWKLYGMGKIIEAADPKLCREFDEEEMGRLMTVGLWCVHPDSAFRPSIRQVINVLLSYEAPLPILPPEMPVAAYLTPQMKLSTSFLISSCGSDPKKGVSFNNSSCSYTTDSSKLTSTSEASSPSASLLVNTR